MLIKQTKLACLLLIAGAILPATTWGQDWPGWRGADRSDRSQETGLLQNWPEGGPKKVWTNENAGLGYAGFAVVDGRLFTLGLFDDKEFGLCLDANSGEELWRCPLGDRYENGWGDGPRNTPTVDGDNVYFMAARGDLVCSKVADGSVVWKQSMTDLGGEIPFWGYAESPLVDGDKVVCTPGGKQGAIAAFDKNSGDVLWQTKDLNQIAHYSSLISIPHGDSHQLVQLLMDAVVGINPENGAVLWSVGFPGKTAVIPTPVDAGNGRVYVTSGYGAGSSLIQVGDDGAKESWHSRNMSNHHGGVIYVDGKVYGNWDRQGFACQELENGEVLWEDDSINKGAVSYAGGMFYFLEEKSGRVLLIDADADGCKVNGEFTLSPLSEQRNPRGAIWVHPVISNGKLYLRDQEFISCYDIKE
ncbi:MAG: PQQ-binding-like beta-propeller repeat protein [Pirellulaceae bacterium]